MKKNVDLLKPIELGLALSDSQGNIPNFGTENSYVWEFNFSDFDPIHDPQNPDSIKQQGIDFEKNHKFQIHSNHFMEMIWEAGLVYVFRKLNWVTFHSSYDFGYFIKILPNRPLPDDIKDFMGLVRSYFGVNVYDVKHVIKSCNGMFGGLEKVSKSLDVDRVVGMGRQAGSDSLLTLQTS